LGEAVDLVQMIHCLRTKTESLLDSPLRSPWCEELKKGDIICYLANRLRPGSVKIIHRCGDPFYSLENVLGGLAGLKHVEELEEQITFAAWDILQCTSPMEIVKCFHHIWVKMLGEPCECGSMAKALKNEEKMFVVEHYMKVKVAEAVKRDEREMFEKEKSKFQNQKAQSKVHLSQYFSQTTAKLAAQGKYQDKASSCPDLSSTLESRGGKKEDRTKRKLKSAKDKDKKAKGESDKGDRSKLKRSFLGKSKRL